MGIPSRGELRLPAFLPPAPGRRRDTFSPPFPLCCRVEGEESSFSGSRPRGGGQRWRWGSALAALLWAGLGAARAGGGPGRGVVRTEPARGCCSRCQPCPGSWSRQPGCCQGQGCDTAPRSASCSPTTGNNPTPNTLRAHQLAALNPCSTRAGCEGAVPTPKSPQPRTQGHCHNPWPYTHIPHAS